MLEEYAGTYRDKRGEVAVVIRNDGHELSVRYPRLKAGGLRLVVRRTLRPTQ